MCFIFGGVMCVIPIFPEHLCIYMSIDTAKDSVLTIIIIYNDTWWNHKVVFPNAVQISSGLFDVWTDRKLNSNILSIRMIMYIFFVFVDDLHIGLATIVFSWNLSLQSIFFLYINIKIESKISELRPWVKSQITKGFRPKRWRWSLTDIGSHEWNRMHASGSKSVRWCWTYVSFTFWLK